MSCQNQTALSCVRRTASRGRKRGFTLVELLVVISIIGMLMALLLPQIQAARETARGNTCRNNMRGLATALFNNAVRNGGTYPGYMNALILQDGDIYKDPKTQIVNPVSWAVMILTDIDRGTLFDQWRKKTTEMTNNQFFDRKVYIENFLCPSDPQTAKTGAPISFVVNTGQPDGPNAMPGTSTTPAIPRDWGASGMFFDNYSEHPLVKPVTGTTQKLPMEYMRDERVRDPKNRTILLTENLDAREYVFNNSSGGSNWQTAEIEVGSIWSIAVGSVTTTSTPPQVKPQLSTAAAAIGGGGGGGSSGGSSGSTATDPNEKLRINNDAGRGEYENSYYYCRPSSRHPQSVNVAFVETNTQPLRDSVSYFVFVKLMSSDDEGMKVVGQNVMFSSNPNDKALSQYQLSESDVSP